MRRHRLRTRTRAPEAPTTLRSRSAILRPDAPVGISARIRTTGQTSTRRPATGNGRNDFGYGRAYVAHSPQQNSTESGVVASWFACHDRPVPTTVGKERIIAIARSTHRPAPHISYRPPDSASPNQPRPTPTPDRVDTALASAYRPYRRSWSESSEPNIHLSERNRNRSRESYCSVLVVEIPQITCTNESARRERIPETRDEPYSATCFDRGPGTIPNTRTARRPRRRPCRC